jgi:GrpB-like predicted nucleotidyltransferase (UPF0157 family)
MPYDAEWPIAFASLEREVRGIVGAEMVAIDHIGSTAVPGLCAKPKLDAVVVMASRTAVVEAAAALAAAGYLDHGDVHSNGLWLLTCLPGRYRVRRRLYACVVGTPAHEARLVFRDRLRTRPDAAAAYAALKRRLAVEFAGDVDGYTRAKGAFVEKLIRGAGALRYSAAALGA